MAYPFTKPETGDEVQDAAQWAVILLPMADPWFGGQGVDAGAAKRGCAADRGAT